MQILTILTMVNQERASVLRVATAVDDWGKGIEVVIERMLTVDEVLQLVKKTPENVAFDWKTDLNIP